MAVAVIGSGIAALACTKALLSRGVPVTVIDAGMTLGAERAAVVHRMQSTTPANWSAADVERVSENPSLYNGHVPHKLAFGSDYIYAHSHPAAPVSGNHHASPTLAFGGYGNVWGAAVLPPDPNDIKTWPIPHEDLERSYQAVFEWLPISGADDGLARAFPLHTKRALPVRICPQTAALLQDLDRMRHSDTLHGQARLAVSAAECRYCGQCLSGCVYGAIFNPADVFQQLVSNGQIDYQRGWVVKTVKENGRNVRVTARRLESSERHDFFFDQVFVAAGTINSTRIVLESLDYFGRPVLFKESQKFVVPLLRLPGAPIAWPQSITLPAVFLEMKLPALGGHWMHMQISATNDFVLRRLRMANGGWRAKLLNPLARRLMAVLCGLHSDHAGGLRATLVRPTENGDASLQLNETGLRRTNMHAKSHCNLLARLHRAFEASYRQLRRWRYRQDPRTTLAARCRCVLTQITPWKVTYSADRRAGGAFTSSIRRSCLPFQPRPPHFHLLRTHIELHRHARYSEKRHGDLDRIGAAFSNNDAGSVALPSLSALAMALLASSCAFGS